MKGYRQERFQASIDHSLGTEAEENLILAGDRGRILRVHGERVANLASGTDQNLRKISVNPSTGTILIGWQTLVAYYISMKTRPSTKLNIPTTTNLRAADWNHDGTVGLDSWKRRNSTGVLGSKDSGHRRW